MTRSRCDPTPVRWGRSGPASSEERCSGNYAGGKRYGDCIKVGGGTLLVVVEEVVVGTSAATRGRAFRADCRGRRNEPGGEGGHPLLTSASAGVFPSSG